ncbi:MAG: hypothetical protein WCA77_08160 [Thermoplasmata archaeon]
MDLPLVYRVPLEEARKELGLASFVDLRDPIVAKAVGLLAAGRRNPGPPLHLALFGGVANRLLSPSSNDPASGLRRELHDLDLACLHREVKQVLGFLRTLADREGNALLFFETPGDHTFNTLSGGRRYRFHDVRSRDGATLEVGTTDVLADEFHFSHVLDLREDVAQAGQNGSCLFPATLLLAKLQPIRRIPLDRSEDAPDRVLEPFGKRSILIGAEEKDRKDVLALLHDLPVGEGVRGISSPRLTSILRQDWGLWKTVTLNLGHLRATPTWKRLRSEQQEVIEPRLEEVLRIVRDSEPKRRMGFLKSEWWDEVDEVAATEPAVGDASGKPRG